MASPTVRLKGYRETMRSLERIQRGASKVVRDELKEAAAPVVAGFRARVGRYRGASVSTIGPRASVRGVFVTQRKRKVTGSRGDFGALQMRHLLSAAAEREDETRQAVEDALDRLTREEGF